MNASIKGDFQIRISVLLKWLVDISRNFVLPLWIFQNKMKLFIFSYYLHSLEYYGATKDEEPIFSEKCDIHILN